MNQILLAFITGLTTGGLSCLAVQGGLLASSLARQIEQDLNPHTPVPLKDRKKVNAQVRPNPALPIVLFLFAKLVAYTILGSLLGGLGSFLTFDPITRAILLMIIGLFMVGNALRMFNVHPIFRYFNLEPPKFITRYIRQTARNDTLFITPLFLGMMTVFIPCGVTQAMMAAALATGSPAAGASLMFAFTLGTSPVFFLVAYLTTQLGARMERFFLRFVAVVVLILGLVSLNNGLNLIGSPLSLTRLTGGLFPGAENTLSQPSPAEGSMEGAYALAVKNNGYFPQTLIVPANQRVTLELVTDQTRSCARDFVIPALEFYELLPETGRVAVEIDPQPAGTTIPFTCSMGMYTGQIVFTDTGAQP